MECLSDIVFNMRRLGGLSWSAAFIGESPMFTKKLFLVGIHSWEICVKDLPSGRLAQLRPAKQRAFDLMPFIHWRDEVKQCLKLLAGGPPTYHDDTDAPALLSASCSSYALVRKRAFELSFTANTFAKERGVVGLHFFPRRVYDRTALLTWLVRNVSVFCATCGVPIPDGGHPFDGAHFWKRRCNKCDQKAEDTLRFSQSLARAKVRLRDCEVVLGALAAFVGDRAFVRLPDNRFAVYDLGKIYESLGTAPPFSIKLVKRGWEDAYAIRPKRSFK